MRTEQNVLDTVLAENTEDFRKRECYNDYEAIFKWQRMEKFHQKEMTIAGASNEAQ